VDWTFLGCAALAVLIAVSLSSVELLTKYQTRNVQEIFCSWYYVGFALLNALFCFLVYLALPFLKIEINSNLVSLGEQPLIRAIVAGLGYLVIARTSVLDIKTPSGEPVGVGFDVVYNGLAQYLLGFHAKWVKKKIRDDFFKVFQGDQIDEPLVLLSATKFIIAQASTADEQSSLSNKLDLGKELPGADYCFYLYQLIRDNSPDVADATKQIADHRLQVAKNSKHADALRAELSWLYSSTH
jgi:hypothetical protein